MTSTTSDPYLFFAHCEDVARGEHIDMKIARTGVFTYENKNHFDNYAQEMFDEVTHALTRSGRALRLETDNIKHVTIETTPEEVIVRPFDGNTARQQVTAVYEGLSIDPGVGPFDMSNDPDSDIVISHW